MAGRGPSRRHDRGWRRMAGAALLLGIPALLLTACGSDRSGVTGSVASTNVSAATSTLTVEVDPPQGVAGQSMTALVANGTDEQYTYGAAYELERQIDGRWEKVALPPTPVPEIGYVAPPGENGPPVSFEIPNDAAAGAWRVVIARNVPGFGILSGQFEVVDG